MDVLLEAGVKQIYGVSGDSLNGITDSIRTRSEIQWIHVRHEEVAAFAAGAETHLAGSLAVCAGSCGPGNLQLINWLYDCHRSRVPAIAAQIPGTEIGRGYFQTTHPDYFFHQCSRYCELASQPSQMPRVLEIAIQTAISRRSVAVVALPGDVAMREAVHETPRVHFAEAKPKVCSSDDELNILADLLQSVGFAALEWRASPKHVFAVYYAGDHYGRNFLPDTTDTAHPRTVIEYGGRSNPTTECCRPTCRILI